jgi:hypothetical protein
MDLESFLGLHPRLFHLASDGSWPSICDNGLLTTAQQVKRCSPPPDIADSILRQRRPEVTWLTGPDDAPVCIRDQKPLRINNLTLVGTDLQGFLELLNGCVFFWPTEERVAGLLNGRAYRKLPQHLLVVDSASLLAAHSDRIRLTPFNTGATLRPPPYSPPRGPATFQRMADYQWAATRRTDGRRPVGEVVVVDGVPDIAKHVIEVVRVAGGERTTIYP